MNSSNNKTYQKIVVELKGICCVLVIAAFYKVGFVCFAKEPNLQRWLV
jgi:hypothetical protein